MSKSNLLKLIIVSTIIVTTVLLAYFLVFKFDVLKSGFLNGTPVVTTKKSVFRDVAGNSGTETLEEIFEQAGDGFYDDPQGMLIFSLGWGLQDFNHYAEWDYERIPFWAKVKDVSVANSELTIEMLSPKSNPLLATTLTIAADTCNPTNTFIFSNSANQYRNGNLSFIDEVKKEDDIISFCMDNECKSLGRICKIVKY